MKPANNKQREGARELTADEKRAVLDELGVLDPESDDLQNALQELGDSGGGTVRVDRIRNGGGREYVDEFDVSAFTLKLLRDTYGGGDYLLQVRDAQKRYRKQARVSIAASAKPAVELTRTPSEPSAIDKMLTAMQEQTKLLTLAIMRNNQAPAADQGAQRRAWLEEMQLMKTIFDGGSKTDATGVLDILKQGMEIAQQGSGDGSPWPGVVATAADKLGEPLMALATAIATRPRAPSQPAPRPAPQPVRAIHTPPAQPRTTLEASPVPKPADSPALRLGINFLVERAAAGSPPELYAEAVIDSVDDDVLALYLGENMDNVENLVEILAGVDPRVKDHLDWFRTLGQAVSEAFVADATGPTGAAPDHGATGENT